MNGKNRIMIFGPKDDGTYVVEFRTAEGEALAISIPRGDWARVVSEKPETTRCSGAPPRVQHRGLVPAALESEAVDADARYGHHRDGMRSYGYEPGRQYACGRHFLPE